MKGISAREFVALDGCSNTLVSKKIKEGYLKTFADGSIDPALAGTDWRKRSYTKKKGKVDEPVHTDEADDGADDPDKETARTAAAAMVSASGYVMLSEADAKARKENFAARLRELEFDIKSRKVVLIDDVMNVVDKALGRVKAKLETIPSACATRLAAISDAETARLMLDEEIARVLSELIIDIRQ